MIALFLALLVGSTPAPAAPMGQAITIMAPAVDEDAVSQALRPITEAIARERARQASLPPADTDSEKLIRMGRLDQIVRISEQGLDLTHLPVAEANAVRGRALGLAHAIDLENQAALIALAPSARWFTFEDYGEEASRAAFYIVQHANVDLWRIYVPLLEPLVGTGQIDDAQYALMYDRLAINEGRPQRYGSQYTCEGRQSRLAPLETDEATVDERRAAMGMVSMADNAKRFEHSNPCQFNAQQ